MSSDLPTDAIEDAVETYEWELSGDRHASKARTQLDALKEEVARLLAGLVLARGMVEEWAAYASDYYQEHWDLPADLTTLDKIIGGNTK